MTRAIENCESHSSRHTPCAVRPKPRGFTLVEVLVVISIIGLLVGLLLPAINAARRRAKMTAIKTEMTQLALALEDFRNKVGGGQYPPDGTNGQDVLRFLKAAFPRAAWGNGVTVPTNITPDTALCFWLGGAQDASGAFIGFSANPANPFDGSQSRIPISYEFDKTTNATRFFSKGPIAGPSNPGGNTNWALWQYFPLNGKDITYNSPFVYFKAVAGQYTASSAITLPSGSSLPAPTVFAYKDSITPAAFINPKTYQLLCAGLDGRYGKTTDGNGPLYPAGTNYDQAYGSDDMGNFTQSATVGDDAQ